jgi:putative Mg2+ transporter-C (MgtC) family protein
MLQANYLLVTHGRAPDSFIMADVLRLPLGVLSGMGFIGGGAILRRGSLVLGVTTAATLWFVTIMGLCFGGGQILLGMTMLVVGLAVLWGLLLVEEGIEQDRRGSLIVSLGGDGPSEAEVRSSLLGAGFKILSAAVTYTAPAHLHEIRCDLQWRGHPSDVESPAVLRQLAERSGVVKVEWRT